MFENEFPIQWIVSTLDRYLIFILLIAAGFYIAKNYKNRLLDYGLSLITSAALSEGLKFIFNTSRPNPGFEGGGFPSTHTAIAFNTFFFLLLVCHALSPLRNRGGDDQSRKIAVGVALRVITVVFLLVSAVGIGVLRILIGAHYLLDVFAGIVLGLFTAIPFKYYDISARRLK